ncbi:MAG TPA: putative metal-binding motif-containing protein [Candidatus Thermoplasmatota archaeon]|nr:putative metal-binding motif-containing protein [Candidatus Thermoplasmatota archaeon]
MRVRVGLSLLLAAALSLVALAPLVAAVDADADGVEPPMDCDDFDSTTYPGAFELHDGRDNDCDGFVDEGTDEDGDGYLPPEDCDDRDPAVNPEAPEWPDGRDNDCDGIVDDVPDDDGDGVHNVADNCRETPNADQADFESDGRGDACDDSDGDGLLDIGELAIGAEPFVRDTDRDGLLDGPEVHAYGTSPVDADTDGDLHGDGTEVDAGSDPEDPTSVPATAALPRPVERPLGRELGPTDALAPVL